MGYKRYEKYKDSGVEWIGEIPEHWEVTKLKNILLINDGGTWGEESDDEGSTVVLRSTEIKIDGSWDIQEPARRKLSPKEKKRCLLKTGDLLVTKSSGSEQHIGKTAIVNEHIERLECTFSNFMQRLRVNRNTCPRFVYYFINSHVGRTQLQYLSTTTTGLGNITSQILNAIIIPYGGYNEQTAIANFLDQKTVEIDSLIVNKEKLIQLLQEKRQAIISEVVTKGLDRNVPMKDSGVEWIGEIPGHWKLNKITWIFNLISSGTTPSSTNLEYYDGCIPWVNTGDLNDEYIYDTAKKITEIALRECSALKLFPVNTLLIAMYGATIGKLGITKIVASTNQACCALVGPKSAIIKFIFYWFLANRNNIISMAYGGGQPNISQNLIKSLRIPLPKMEEQNAIVNFLDQKTAEIDSLITNIQTQIAKLKEYRQSLISEAVTGKIDVRGFTPNTEGVVTSA